MAAATELHAPQLVNLRQLRAEHLDPLLRQESSVWRQKLDWDFQASAALIRRFLDLQALHGCALMVDGWPVGYSYYVCEERKGLIGDLFVSEQYATPANESLLLNSVINDLLRTPNVLRVESQLMMLRGGDRVVLPRPGQVKGFKRNFMEMDLGEVVDLDKGRLPEGISIDAWSERKQDEAATVVSNAYRGHVDSDINDQYRSPAGARRFLMNIVQFPGCGNFYQGGSFIAVDLHTGRLAGISLTSMIAGDVGHLTQICVLHALRGTGVGYELLRHSLQALAERGCRKASLTVTASNAEAIRLYEAVGFQKTREFSAYVWEGF